MQTNMYILQKLATFLQKRLPHFLFRALSLLFSLESLTEELLV